MDPLTHSLTGLAMSRAGFNRLVPHSAWILLLAANAPDIDVATAAGGQAAYLQYHRHLTHALIMIPAMALLPVLVVRLFARKPFDWKRGYLVSLAGAASHPLLDWTNNYGIRLLLPFSGEWFRLDLINVFDLWLWAVLILAAVAPLLSRLVSSEIGAKSSSGRGIAMFALCFVVLYGVARFVLHERAVAVLESRLYNGAAPTRVAAFPGPANPLRWRGLIETSAFYGLTDVDLAQEFDPSATRILYKPQPGPDGERSRQVARNTEAFRVFLGFSQFPYWTFSPLDDPEGGLRVQAMDLRFGSPPNGRFLASAVIKPNMTVTRSWFSFSPEDQPR